MNNNVNQEQDLDQNQNVDTQQTNRRGFPPGPPGFSPPPTDRGGPSSPPSMGNRREPPSPPPRFIPEMPSGDGAQPFSGRAYSPEGYGRGQRGSMSFWRCLNKFTYVWLLNGDNFWFYPTYIGRQHVEGFRWRNGRWTYERYNQRWILFFHCFN